MKEYKRYMKKVFLILLGVVTSVLLPAQTLQQNESALVYYSPKTEIVLDFSYIIETQEAGPYAEYAEELLGALDIVKTDSTAYQLEGVKVHTRTLTDYNRPHKVSLTDGIPMLLTLNEKQILKGYNIAQHQDTPASPKPQPCVKKDAEKTAIRVAPYTDEVLKASDSTALAEAVAQQILHLRETRTYLLSGEVEHAPADGNAMRQVLAELDKQEQALTELFVGKRNRRTAHWTVTIQPEQAEQFFFFSAENGFTDGDNIDADTIRVELSLMAQTYLQKEEPVEEEITSKKKKCKKEVKPAEPEMSPIVYNLPGSAEIKVLYKNRLMAGKTVPVAQAGIDVPLPKCLFSEETLPVIIFNEKTGNIVSISK